MKPRAVATYDLDAEQLTIYAAPNGVDAMAGGWPNPFNWPLFIAGETIGLAGFAAALRRSQNAATADE